ncbi:hypothetical protein ES288_A12G197100v1 [Gossypium darwinii]|uniref:Uncharacterized protein n=1 Tax=Gossypium darwinii TaxID=34276 RepID=A0A5D2ECC0_GOSDA|nr:hypothetical protein ES288_A12G197100v1 [Gossypium darwinii]
MYTYSQHVVPTLNHHCFNLFQNGRKLNGNWPFLQATTIKAKILIPYTFPLFCRFSPLPNTKLHIQAWGMIFQP